MLARVDLACADCGTVRIPPASLVIRRALGHMLAQFTCPQCSNWQSKPISTASGSHLLAVGARVGEVTAHPEPHVWGPPIDYDDLLDFGLGLRGCDQLCAVELWERTQPKMGHARPL